MSGWFSRALRRHVFPRRPCLSISRSSRRQSLTGSHTPCPSISTSTFEYGYIEDVETLEDYRPGGYHPIQIDDRFRKRYRVVHKLGHGAFSTAWLALDEQTSKYVAIKVGTADANRREVDILCQLTAGVGADACSRSADKASMIPLVIDSFNLDGPNGTHPCFVTVPARCSLMDSKEASGPRLFQLNVARSLAAQLAMAVSYVHSQGYVHGDLHLGNVLLQLPSSLNNLSVEQLYAKFGATEVEPVVRLDGKPPSGTGVPSYAIPPVWLGIASDEIELNNSKLLLSDFGAAFCPSDEEERVALFELLHWMLAWRPKERPSAEEVLDTAWMKRWALPAYEEGRRAWE